MADKKLNAVSTASDGAYVYAEDANGNQIKISKADLASVVAGLIGLTGIKIKKYVNSNSGAGSLDLFSGVTTGIIFIVMNQSSTAGHKNNIVFVQDADNLIVNDFNVGTDHHYQVLSISNGRVSISNTGYGVGAFTAYWLS